MLDRQLLAPAAHRRAGGRIALGAAALFGLLLGGALLAFSLVNRIEQAKDGRIASSQRYLAAIDDVALGAQVMATHDASSARDGAPSRRAAIAEARVEVEDALRVATAVFPAGSREQQAARRIDARFREWAATVGTGSSPRRRGRPVGAEAVTATPDHKPRFDRDVRRARRAAEANLERGNESFDRLVDDTQLVLAGSMVAMLLVGGGITVRLLRSALMLVRVRERLQDRAARQTILADLGRRALAASSGEAVTAEVLDLAREILRGDLVCFYELRPDGELDVQVHDAERERIRGTVPRGRAGLAAAALESGGPVTVHDLSSGGPALANDLVRDLGAVSGAAVPVLQGGEPRGVLSVHMRRRGTATDEDAAFLGSLANVLAAALERAGTDAELRRAAVTDPLTGLPNHRAFTASVAEALADARSGGEGPEPTVLFLDLDGFREINDTGGHSVGDALLVAVAERLRTGLRGRVVARLGGDEFGVLGVDRHGAEDTLDLADSVTFLLAEPFALDGALHTVTAGIGVAVGTGGDGTAEDLVRDAHTAMYRAKRRGPQERELFDPATRRRLLAEVSLRDDLRRALDRDELHLVFQPIVALRGARRLVHVEALLRWQSPTRGLVPPADFIPLAETSGLIAPLGRWVLEEACRHAARWSDERPDLPPLGVSVNVSPFQLREPGYWHDVRVVLDRTGVDPSLLALELTESALMDSGELIAPVQLLRDVGCRLFLDDFGTGYSSLAYLRSFPVDVVKIDRSFVSGVGQELGDSAIVAATISMAHSLGVEVVGEGVETARQIAHLELIGCDYAQGYHVSRPLAASQVPGIRERFARPVGAATDAA